MSARRSITGRAGLVLCISMIACGAEGRYEIIAHRAQGIGEHGENIATNVQPLMMAGFGVEVDIRADGTRTFELGHFSANGYNLEDVLQDILDKWQPELESSTLVLDISDDTLKGVSTNLLQFLYAFTAGNQLETLHYIIQSSTEDSLARMEQTHVLLGGTLNIQFMQTYWITPAFTPALWLDFLGVNLREIGEFRYPKPFFVFDVNTRASFRRVGELRSDVAGIITNHPRRVAEFQGGPRQTRPQQ